MYLSKRKGCAPLLEFAAWNIYSLVGPIIFMIFFFNNNIPIILRQIIHTRLLIIYNKKKLG